MHTLKAEYEQEDFTVVAVYKNGSPAFSGSPKLTEEVKSEIAKLEKQYYLVMDARGAFAKF
jgi:hypothetical protein